ncbi:MAG TPA: Asp-tRNA(Asn)/Glu-tRNA(Gln) amidotransferase subunit GatC [Deltaproteobacteria bacterium]|nr:Asp-tRNA(Asn)/Glu-tRNA(Gln) amidotransferase subunit GatC [Deltaproteobacteria bacterium]
MSRIEPSDVARVATLARLALSQDEIAAMTRDLEQMLDYVAALDRLDTQDVEPTAHSFELPTPLRPDRAVPPLDPEIALGNAPEREGTAFLVPKVLEEGG